jgi:hypothetical protein
MLESLNEYVSRAGGSPSTTDRLLVFLKPNETTVYLNDTFEIRALVRAKKGMEAGHSVGRSDIAQLVRLEFGSVTVPRDCGVVLFLSHGWRRGLFFDFRPSHPDWSGELDYELEVVGAELLSHLWFTEFFVLTPDDWELVLDAGWFPFISLIGADWEHLLHCLKNCRDRDRVMDAIENSLTLSIDDRLESWLSATAFKQDEQFLLRGVAAFKAKDWLTTVSLLLPRIEGIFRRCLAENKSAKSLISMMADRIQAGTHRKNLLFPVQFSEFLQTNYYQRVDFGNDDETVNRHSLAHGVVSGEAISREDALKVLLTIDHIFYCV